MHTSLDSGHSALWTAHDQLKAKVLVLLHFEPLEAAISFPTLWWQKIKEAIVGPRPLLTRGAKCTAAGAAAGAAAGHCHFTKLAYYTNCLRCRLKTAHRLTGDIVTMRHQKQNHLAAKQ